MNTLTLGLEYIDRVLAHEGGYVNNPVDKGGETNWGVTAETARRFGYRGEMRAMTRSQAVDVYMQLFWVNRFDAIAARGMPDLAFALLDFGVNSGNGRPAEALQRTLNSLNRNNQRWTDIGVDGGIGPMTLKTLSLASVAFKDAEELITFAVNSLRCAFIINLVERSPKQEEFMLGWLRRMLLVSKQSGGKSHA